MTCSTDVCKDKYSVELIFVFLRQPDQTLYTLPIFLNQEL